MEPEGALTCAPLEGRTVPAEPVAVSGVAHSVSLGWSSVTTT
ncbi:hypothetical protein [Streptomyces mirabilis]